MKVPVSMQITVKGKHIDVGDALRTHVESQLNGAVSKYFAKPIEAQVVLAKNGSGAFHADIAVHPGRGILVHGSGEAQDAYAAVDLAIEHVGKRLRRYKRRLKDHHADEKRERRFEVAPSYVLAPEDETIEPEIHDEPGREPVVIAEMTAEIETLTVSEAVMRMDLSGQPVMLFRNRGHDGLNLVYRRADGNIGWIDPQGNAVAGGGVPAGRAAAPSR